MPDERSEQPCPSPEHRGRTAASLRAGDQRLASELYDELRRLARRELSNERPDHTLQPTALVNEAYLRLLGGDAPSPDDRAAFFAAAVVAIRRVLVDHARRRDRLKRGADRRRTLIELDALPLPLGDEQLLALDVALERLAQLDARKARLVDLRFFAGLTIPEVAELLETSPTTIQRDWRLARAWLRDALGDLDAT